MFQSVKPNKISQYIIEQIRQAIFEGRLKPGDKLPSEKELVENFQVGKATLREALRALEVLGFLEIRKGAAGGAFITEVDMDKARDLFLNFLHFQHLSLKDLSEVRLLLESYTAEKAAQGITESDLRRLDELNRESEALLKTDLTVEARQNEIEFHRLIGSVVGNPLLGFILDFVENLLIDAKETLKPEKEFYWTVLEAHRRIHAALVDRNPEKAREEMVRHVREVGNNLLILQEQKDSWGLWPTYRQGGGVR
jgi:GntR family transcriptional regulator, transcriptional repressor for pyruvate dehydrogenase complex